MTEQGREHTDTPNSDYIDTIIRETEHLINPERRIWQKETYIYKNVQTLLKTNEKSVDTVERWEIKIFGTEHGHRKHIQSGTRKSTIQRTRIEI